MKKFSVNTQSKSYYPSATLTNFVPYTRPLTSSYVGMGSYNLGYHSEYLKEREIEEMKNFYHREFEKVKEKVTEDCQHVIVQTIILLHFSHF